jgi:ketosteroid isomerase-like protein
MATAPGPRAGKPRGVNRFGHGLRSRSRARYAGTCPPPPPIPARSRRTYLNGFRTLDRALILSCLTDDVEWVIPGAFETRGKAGFAEHIVERGFAPTPPVITETRIVEAGDVVVVEGTVRAARADGAFIDLMFCDVFEMRNAKIRRLVSYLVVLGQTGSDPGLTLV